MKKEYLNTIVPELMTVLQEYKNILELDIIEKCDTIIEVGALTVGTDESGKIIAQNVKYPSQFSKKATETIFAMTWINGNGQRILPKAYSRNQWYNEKTNQLKKTLDLLSPVSPKSKNLTRC